VFSVVVDVVSAAATRWPIPWNTEETGYILNRSTGFAALMRLLPDVYLDLGAVGSVPSVEALGKYLSRSGLTDADFNKEIFIPGTGGETRLYSALVSDMKFKRESAVAT
jgi:hypothetical protein